MIRCPMSRITIRNLDERDPALREVGNIAGRYRGTVGECGPGDRIPSSIPGCRRRGPGLIRTPYRARPLGSGGLQVPAYASRVALA
jgi:hypothetical protein